MALCRGGSIPLLRLALGQLNQIVGDLSGNARRVAETIRYAQAWMADLVIVPELAIPGYPPEDLLLKPQFIEANQRALEQLAPLTRGITAVVGYVDGDPSGRLYNAAAVLSGGRHVATYRKQCLPNYGVFDEKRYFFAGTKPLIIRLGGIPIGVTICEDVWAPGPCQALAAAGARLVVNLSASPYHMQKLKARTALFRQRATQHRLAIAYCNLVGGQDELVFDGGSLVLNADGQVIAQAAQLREDVLVCDLAEDGVGPQRRFRGAQVALTAQSVERPFLSLRCAPVLSVVEEVYAALTLGVRDYVRKNGFTTVVLGLSGGIDSALTACIAVDALGALNVKGIVMPSRYSSAETQADAKTIAHALGMEVHEIAIESMFKTFLETLRPLFGARPADLTEQNLQARIRGTLLMALSNKFGWLVLTTGNKSETATGYTTLYGDMAGGFAVIKDVPKTLVYQLARFRNRRTPKAIPARVFKRAPTAELAFNQRDQDTLPPYAVLDRILKSYVEEDRSLREILQRNQVDSAVVRKVLSMVDHSEYKRRQGPPGVKITPKAFGRDRRMPITNQYHQT